MLRRVRASRYATELGRFVRANAQPGRVNLLAPDRSVFRFDLDALDRYAPRLHLIRMSTRRQLPSMLLREHQSLSQRNLGAPVGSPDDPFSRSQPMLERALADCVRAGLLQGFMSSNVDYHQDEPLRRAAERLGLPFFIILKETPISPEHEAWQRRLIGEHPVRDRGHHVFVGGPLGALYVHLGSVTRERLFDTGFPRFDRYRDLDASVDLDRVTFFPPNRLHGHQDTVASGLLDAAIELQRRVGATLVVKCKDNRSMHEVREALDGRRDLDSVIVTTENPAEHLLRSALIVGSSSTALAEGMLTRARVFNLIAQNDLLGIPTNPRLGYETFSSAEGLVAAMSRISGLAGLPIGVEEVGERRAALAGFLTLPEEQPASAAIEREILRVVDPGFAPPLVVTA